MKRIFKYAAVMMIAFVVASACQKDLDIDYSSAEPMLQMTAELMSSESSHQVFLTLATPKGPVSPAEDALVRCYVNGEFVSETSEIAPYRYSENVQVHTIEASFQPGDKVRLEAISGDLSVYAESVFAKTCNVQLDFTSDAAYSEGEEVGLGMIEARNYHFRLTVDDVPDETTYFQARVPSFWYEREGYEAAELTYLREYDYAGIMDMEDPVFAGVTSPVPGDLEAETGLPVSFRNYYLIFSDNLFTDSSYSFYFDFNQKDLLSHTYVGWMALLRSYVHVRVVTMQEETFKYYNSLNLARGAGAFTEPVKVIDNVVGGAGYVAALTASDVWVELQQLKDPNYVQP